jgi:hypothetical protein
MLLRQPCLILHDDQALTNAGAVVPARAAAPPTTHMDMDRVCRQHSRWVEASGISCILQVTCQLQVQQQQLKLQLSLHVQALQQVKLYIKPAATTPRSDQGNQ